MINIINKEQFLIYLNQSLSMSQLFRFLGYKLFGGLNPKTIERIEKRYNVDIRKQIEENKKKAKLNKPVVTYICKQCGKNFTEKYSKWASGDFCCRKCANTYSSNIKRNEINVSLSKKLKGKKYINGILFDLEEEYNKNPKICPICGNVIPYENHKYKTCSKECGIKQMQLTMKNKGHYSIGGYVPFSCRSRHGYYKGIYCDSTYELAYLIYCLDHNIDIKRCDESFEYEYNGKKHKYHPDFVVNGEIIEIKNYYREINDIKMNAVNKPIKILYYDDLQDIFEYISSTYNKKYNKHNNNFYELYDN